MAATPIVMYRGNTNTYNTNMYTTPAGKTAIVTNIVIRNNGSSTATAMVRLNMITLVNMDLTAGQTLTLDLKQVLPTGQILDGSSSNANMMFHISGVEV